MHSSVPSRSNGWYHHSAVFSEELTTLCRFRSENRYWRWFCTCTKNQTLVTVKKNKTKFPGLGTKCRQSILDMAALSIFPVEILEWITSVATTSQQLRLWQCGDRILNTKLANGGLKSTSLHWSSASWMPWPCEFFAISTQLSSIAWNVDSRTSLCPSLDINLLPKTLQRLQLDCEDVFCVLRQQNANLDDLLPSLQVLKLKGKRLSEENLKQLPSQLIELSVDSEESNMSTGTLFGDLPRTIEHLHFNFNVEDLEEFGNDLPSGLKSLHIRMLIAEYNWFAKLPKSLKSLSFRTFEEFVPDWPSLPPQLEELSFAPDANVEGDVDELPSMDFGRGPGVPSSILPLLPKGLKSLRLSIVPPLTDQDIDLLPKSLTRFRNNKMHRISQDGIQRLPRSLTDFDQFVKLTPDVLSFYPPETTRVNLISTSPLTLNMVPLPKLSTFSMIYINDDICECLPPQLTSLKADKGILTEKGASKLPKSLLTLHINLGVFSANEVISYLRYIPKIEFSVSAKGEMNVDANWLTFLRPSSSLDLKSVNDVASSGTISGELDINMGYRDSTFLGPNSFESLSQFLHLSVLHIYAGWKIYIPADYIQFVPKNLRELEIGTLERFPTPSVLSTLPKRLAYLRFRVNGGTCTWKDEDLETLPRSLQTLLIGGKCSFPNMTRNMQTHLPPYLIELKVDGSTHELFTPPLDNLYGLDPDEE